MPAITYKDFSGGLDRRLPIGVQDASRLWVLKNAYITSGKKIAKRPGLKLINSALAGSAGLAAMNGSLSVFVEAGTTFFAPSGMTVYTIDQYSGSGSSGVIA